MLADKVEGKHPEDLIESDIYFSMQRAFERLLLLKQFACSYLSSAGALATLLTPNQFLPNTLITRPIAITITPMI